METILHLLPLTPDEQDRFRAAAPHEEHLFLPTSDRRGAAAIPQDWRECTTILMGFVPPEDLKTFPKLKWIQSWNAGVDPYLAPGVLPAGVVLTCAAGAYGPAVSEHMLAMLLAIYKRLPAYRDQQNTRTWTDLGHVRSLRTSKIPAPGPTWATSAPCGGRPCWWVAPATSAATLPGCAGRWEPKLLWVSTAQMLPWRTLTKPSPCPPLTACSPRPTWWLWPSPTTLRLPVCWTAAACC